MKSYFKKTAKKLICLAVILSMCISLMPAVFAADEKPWDEGYNHSINIMPFTPAEGYVCEQNPPKFKWGLVTGAESYELIVAKDRELKEIVYQKDGIKHNYITPEVTLETGISLYWAARSKEGNKTSTWSTVRKFRIDPDAFENPIPPTEELMKRIPAAHPRVWLKPDELEEFRSYKDNYEGSKAVYDDVMKTASQYAESGQIDKEPEPFVANTYEEKKNAGSIILNLTMGNINRAFTCGFAYLISGDEKIGRYAADLMLELSTWNWKDGISSYKSQDQVHRAIAYKGAMVYDWIYPLLTESEKTKILEHIRNRTLVMEYLLNSLEKSPYDSHGWTAYGFIGIIAIATYGEIPEAEGWLEKVIAGYTTLIPVWSYEDGGWSQGTGYAQYSRNTNHEFMEVLARSGILNLYKNAWTNKEYLWELYAKPYYGWGSFGDEAYFMAGNGKSYSYDIYDMMHDIFFTDDAETNGIRKWLVEKGGGFPKTSYSNYWLATKYEKTEMVLPAEYQNANEFYDIGWVNMSSDILDPDSILLTFKSSPFGSFNHSHADQNSFFIQAYGRPIAVKSGYYDSYHSEHDSGFTRKTGAHNSVTVATNKGQRDDDFSAEGKLTGYLTQIDFDLAKGDATEAYKGGLGKFERSIIYIRPDMFVVVDDLKAAKNKKKSKFEWWLNAEHAMEIYEDQSGARINENGAMLDAKVQYPQNVKAYYNDIFALSDMKEYNKLSRFQNSNVQTRVWFETEKVDKTKMIVTLDVHRDTQEARYVDTEYFDNYVKMTFEDGTILYVNLGENTKEVVTKDGISFTGLAVVYNDESIMLVGGTNVKQGETDLIILEKEGSVVMGRNELSLSTYVDNRISVNVNNSFIGKIESVTDYKGRELRKEIGITYEGGKLVKAEAEEKKSAENSKSAEEEETEPVYTVEADENYKTFTCEMDNYQLMLNGKLIKNKEVSSTVKITVDGVEKEVPMSGYNRRDGMVNYAGTFTLDGMKYKVIDKSEDLNAGSLEIGRTAALTTVNLSTTSDKQQYLVLEKVPIKLATVRTETDYDAIKSGLAVFKEAEDYKGNMAAGANVYTTRSFLSGGKGVQLFNTPGTQMIYELEVKEEGDYQLVVKYVAWEEGGATRAFNLNGADYNFTMEQTADWGTVPENWRAAVCEESIHLTPGKYTISFDVVAGSWNYDWFGLIKK